MARVARLARRCCSRGSCKPELMDPSGSQVRQEEIADNEFMPQRTALNC